MYRYWANGKDGLQQKKNIKTGCDILDRISNVDSSKWYSVLLMIAFNAITKPLSITRTQDVHIRRTIDNLPKGYKKLINGWRKMTLAKNFEEITKILLEMGNISKLDGIPAEKDTIDELSTEIDINTTFGQSMELYNSLIQMKVGKPSKSGK